MACNPGAVAQLEVDHGTREIPTGDVRLLLGRLVGLFGICRQLRQRVEYIASASRNEKVLSPSCIRMRSLTVGADRRVGPATSST